MFFGNLLCRGVYLNKLKESMFVIDAGVGVDVSVDVLVIVECELKMLDARELIFARPPLRNRLN